MKYLNLAGLQYFYNKYIKKINEDITGINSDITTLNGNLEQKANASHTHTASQVTDLSNASVNYANSAGSANAVAWSNVSGKPSTFTPASHTQGWSTITGKPSTYTPASHTHDDRYYTESEVNNLVNARVPSSRIKSHVWVSTVNGTSIDVNFSQVGLTSGANYVIFVNNSNRNAANLTVLGVSINQAATQFRIYWDDTTTGTVQFSMVAIQI